MRIAVIGTGNIGGTLGRALARAGHQVTFGTRHAVGDEVSGDTGATAAGVAEALDVAQVVLLALPGPALEDFLGDHAAAINGKLVVDATNRIGASVTNGAAVILAAAPQARYARAFNILGWENFAEPVFDGAPADLFFSAPSADRPVVEELITAVGLRPAYLGENKQDVVDGVLPLWFSLVQANGGNRHLAFRVVQK